MGGVQNSSGNSGGVGGYFSGQNLEIPGRRGGLREIPSVVGVWIFSGTTHYTENSTYQNPFYKIMYILLAVSSRTLRRFGKYFQNVLYVA